MEYVIDFEDNTTVTINEDEISEKFTKKKKFSKIITIEGYRDNKRIFNVSGSGELKRDLPFIMSFRLANNCIIENVVSLEGESWHIKDKNNHKISVIYNYGNSCQICSIV